MALTVTATASGAGSANGIELALRVLTGASLTQNGATAASETVTAPELAITPHSSGSWVYGAVGTGASATAFSSPAGSITSIANSTVVSGGRWGMYRSGSTTTSSTTYGWAAPTGTSGNIYIAQAEILASGTLAEDASTPAVASSSSAKTITTASFTPPAGAVLVALVTAQWSGSGATAPALSDSGSAYTWSQLIGTGTADLCSVWVGIPKAFTSTAALTVTPSFTAHAASGTSAALTVAPTFAAAANGRSQYTWPFSYDSIWNLPIASTAGYAPSGITVTSDYSTDPSAVEYCCTDPAQPVKSLTNAELSGGGTGAANVYVAPAMSAPGTWNDCAAFLGTDNDTVYQGQTLELTAGGNPQFGGDADAPSAVVSIKSTGITGSHGGSGLSALGGTLTVADLTGSGPIQHAMKVCFNGYEYYSSAGTGYQWPAVSADGGYNVPADVNYYGGSNPDVVLGALLALPPFIDPATKYSDPLIQRIATAMQCYGCYIVDNTASGAGVSDSIIEINYDAASDFTGTGTFSSDFHQMLEDLQVITNSAEATPGGGAIGSNRFAPYAPVFADGTDAPPAVTVVAPVSVLMQSLTDSFPGSSLNPQWGSYGTVTVSGGQAVVASGTSESGIYANSGFMLTGSYMFARVTPYTGGTGPYTYFQAVAETGSGGAGIQYNSGSIWAYWVSSSGAVTSLSSVTYDPVAHAWWRVRESAGTTYFDTAPDGLTWTNRWSAADPIIYGSMMAQFGTAIGSGTAGTSYLADFNVPPPTGAAALTVTPSFTATSATGTGAALTVTPSFTATAAGGSAAALTVTPSFAATGATGTQAALTVTPSFSASAAGASHAALTVTPAFTASEAAGAPASLTVTPTFTATTGEGSTAALTVTPVLAASAAADVSAALTVTPVLSASATRGAASWTASASLTVTPAFTASGADETAAALTVTPVLVASATGTAPGTASAALTVTPSLTATPAASTAASLTVAPVLSASPAAAVGASLTVTPTLAALASAAESAALTVLLSLTAQAQDSTTAALTVTPELAAAGTAGSSSQTAVASLTVSPSFAASAVGSTTAALTVSPAFTATRTRSGPSSSAGLLMAAGLV